MTQGAPSPRQQPPTARRISPSPNVPNAAGSAPPAGPRVPRRLVLGAVLLALIVFGSELALSTMRTRTLNVAYQAALAFSPTPLPPEVPTPTPTRTPDPRKEEPTATPTPEELYIAPGDAMIVNVRWDYRIGPRFQKVTVRASARNVERKDPVAVATAVIDCGSEILACSGAAPIRLNYQVPDANSPDGIREVPWPVGDYTVTVEQSAGGLQYVHLDEKYFHVRLQ